MKCLLLIALLLSSCTQEFLGLSRGDRLQIYGSILDVAGRPEIGVPVGALGQRFKALDKQPRNVSPSGK